MSIQKLFLLFLFFFLPLESLSQEKIVLRESEGVDIIKLMEDNLLFITRIQDIDLGDNGNIFLLDDRSGNVVCIDLKTGSLINKISSPGEGPAELMRPVVVRARKDKLFVLSQSHIKIFTASGDFLNVFKTGGSPRWMDIDKDENIYVAETDQRSNPVISVYNVQGKKIRTAMTFPLTKEILEDRAEYVKRRFFKFRLDPEGNIIILFHLSRRLMKAGPDGALLWEQEIQNSIIKPFLKKEGTRYDDQRPIITYLVSNFDLDHDNNIVIGHAGGGCIYNQGGDLIGVIEVQTMEPRKTSPGLALLKIVGDKLLGIYAGDGTAFLFPYDLDHY